MPVDATGSVSAKLGIYKYNTGADAPSGKGLNNIVDDLDDIISRLGISGPVANDVPVYDSVAGKWKKASGTPSSSVFLRGDGAWAAPTPSGMVLLETLSPSGVSGIASSAIPGTYKNLVVRWDARGDTGSIPTINLRMNGDTGANYEYTVMQMASPSTVTGSSGGGTTSIVLGNVCGVSDPAGRSGTGVLNIPDYTGSFSKGVHSNAQVTSTTNFYQQLITGAWRTVGTAVTSLNFFLAAGNFVAGSKIHIYAEV